MRCCIVKGAVIAERSLRPERSPTRNEPELEARTVARREVYPITKRSTIIEQFVENQSPEV
jgi:hypothetical protein